MNNSINILTLVCMMCTYAASGQVASAGKEKPLYINVNASEHSQVHEIRNEQLDLEYYDYYGTAKEILLQIYDWKRNVVAKAALGKTYGLNYFVIKLIDLGAGWELGKLYTCRLVDESGKKYDLQIRLLPPPEKADFVVDIVVNPLNLKCDDLSNSVVEFYGTVSGGKAPFIVNWMIANDERTKLLYQPKEEVVTSAGKTSVITVDKSPDYFVLVQVKDACGALVQKMVHLVCEDKKKKISTIFVEPLNIEKELTK